MWKKLTERPPLGFVLQLWSRRAPPGFIYRQYGESKRMLADFDGLALVVLRGGNKKTRMVARREKVKQPKPEPIAVQPAAEQEEAAPF